MSDILHRIVEFANRVVQEVDKFSERLPRVLAILFSVLVYLALIAGVTLSILIYGMYVLTRMLFELWTVPKNVKPSRQPHRRRTQRLWDEPRSASAPQRGGSRPGSFHINEEFFSVPRISEDVYAIPKPKELVKIRGWEYGSKKKIW